MGLSIAGVRPGDKVIYGVARTEAVIDTVDILERTEGGHPKRWKITTASGEPVHMWEAHSFVKGR